MYRQLAFCVTELFRLSDSSQAITSNKLGQPLSRTHFCIFYLFDSQVQLLNWVL